MRKNNFCNNNRSDVWLRIFSVNNIEMFWIPYYGFLEDGTGLPQVFEDSKSISRVHIGLDIGISRNLSSILKNTCAPCVGNLPLLIKNW